MTSTRSILCFLLIVCSLAGVLCANNAGGDEESLFGAVQGTFQDVGKQSADRTKKTIRSSGTLLSKLVSAVHSGVNYGMNEVSDVAGRTGEFIDKSLPEQSKKTKDSLGGTGAALLNHSTNQFQRVMSGANEIIKAVDDVSETALEEGTKIVESNPGKPILQAVGKVGSKLNEVQGRIITTAGDVVTNPGGYAAAGLENIKAPLATGVGYLSAINPIPQIGKAASSFWSSWGSSSKAA